MSTLEESLQKLGDTEDSVVSNLQLMGIKGAQMSALQCPIAKYLQRTGFPEALVSPDIAYVSHDESGPKAPLPDSVKDFVHAFDRGDYPELFESGSDE